MACVFFRVVSGGSSEPSGKSPVECLTIADFHFTPLCIPIKIWKWSGILRSFLKEERAACSKIESGGEPGVVFCSAMNIFKTTHSTNVRRASRSRILGSAFMSGSIVGRTFVSRTLIHPLLQRLQTAFTRFVFDPPCRYLSNLLPTGTTLFV